MVTDVHWNMRNQPAARCAQQHKNLPLKRFERKIFTLPKAQYGPVCWHYNWSYLIANLATRWLHLHEMWALGGVGNLATNDNMSFPYWHHQLVLRLVLSWYFYQSESHQQSFNKRRVRQLRTSRPNDRTPCHVHMGSIKTVTLQVLAAGHFPHL